MVVGLDKNINIVVENAKKILGENTIVVFSSDNGGSPWFGGLNTPLRSGKMTPFEGGTRVPAFMLDFSKKYSKTGVSKQIFHISDWLPTFLSWAGASDLVSDMDLDGLDQSEALINDKLVRNDVVLEMVTSDDTHDHSHSIGYR